MKEGQSLKSGGWHWSGKGGGVEAKKQMTTHRDAQQSEENCSTLSVPAELRSYFP